MTFPFQAHDITLYYHHRIKKYKNPANIDTTQSIGASRKNNINPMNAKGAIAIINLSLSFILSLFLFLALNNLSLFFISWARWCTT
jgi:hypothetical protein